MFEKQGFLSDEVSDLSEDIEAKYPGLWKLAYEVNELSHTFQYSLSVHTGVTAELMGAPLYSRVLANYQALLILSKRGMVDQSYAILRVLVESLFYLAAISNDSNFAVEYVQYEEHQRKSALSKLKRYKEAKDKKDPEIEKTARIIREIEKEIVDSNIKKFPTENVAYKAGLHDWYDTVYAFSSSFVHTSARSLQSHIILDEESEQIVGMKNEPDIEGIIFPLSTGVEAIFVAISSVCKIFGMKEPDQLTTFATAFRTLMQGFPNCSDQGKTVG